MKRLVQLGVAAALVLATVSAGAADANPSNYKSVLSTLKPGDTLNLAPGTYASGLDVSGLNGTASAPITIKGPATAIFEGRSCCNTVEITNSSYVVFQGFTLDGKNLDGVFGVSAKGSASNLTHHITIDGLTIVGHGASQQTVGISTKTPTWGWVIRKNKIVAPGTGLYLGNSDGNEAFFDGIIEGNLIESPVGYCMQIKHQNLRPARAGQPTKDSVTIIRHNVFIKNDGPSPDGDRPNLLVDGFPKSGAGANDRYEIYGNLFFHNPRESLLQGAGRMSIHDNVFVDVPGAAIYLANHNEPLELAWVYNNTIYSAGTGIKFGNAAAEGDAVVGNLIFARTGSVGITGSIKNKKDNLEQTLTDALTMVKKPSTSLTAGMDFYPLADKCKGSALDLSSFGGETARDVDFNGAPKVPPVYRGAYHGSGDNPGWALGGGLKDTPTAPAGDAGVGTDSAVPVDASTDSASPTDAATGDAPAADESGCGCRTTRASTSATPLCALVALALLNRRAHARSRR